MEGAMNLLHLLYQEMIHYYKGDPKRIQHFVKVHSFAKLIGQEEGLSDELQLILEATAFVHDIGIKAAEEKYGSCNGKLQEQEGPVLAGRMLEGLGFQQVIIDRVMYLVGHHHTYSDISGIDYQILVEADFLVNLYEDGLDGKAVQVALEKIFKTKTGRLICQQMFLD